MLIACIAVVCLLLIFIAVTFFMTYKTYTFDLEEGKLKVKNISSHLKIYFNDDLIKNVLSPQLYVGEKIDFKINDNEYILFCKCNRLGNKLRIEILKDDKTIYDNGVIIEKQEKEEKKIDE